MASFGLRLVTVELAFDDDPFVLHGGQVIHVRGTRRDNLMWQKERLLNIGITSSLCDDEKDIAWIDADVTFLNDDWKNRALLELTTTPVVQLFGSSVFSDGCHEFDRCTLSCGHRWSTRHKDTQDFCKSHPGFAWAGHASWMREFGLYDRMITGSGDSLMMTGFTHETNYYAKKMSGVWQAHLAEWADAVYGVVQGNMGYVNGMIYHHFHGSHKDRKYAERFTQVSKAGYDPYSDVYVDSNNLLAWTDTARTERAELIQWVENYFAQRNEDSGIQRVQGHAFMV
jgi:hypothetical protein